MGLFQSKRKSDEDEPLSLSNPQAVMDLLTRYFGESAVDVNANLTDETLKLAITKPFKTQEKDADRSVSVLRLIVRNANCGLSVRAANRDLVEAYLLPSSQLVLVPQSEYPSRLKFKLTRQNDNTWWLDGHRVTAKELRMLALTATNDVLKYSHSGVNSAIAEGARITIGDLSLTTGFRDLLFEKAQLVSDLVTQQEVLHAHLAGELHDSVIADLLFLKRELSSGRIIPTDRVCDAIDNVVLTLRGICADFSSRELRDWGLSHSLKELAQRFSERSGHEIVTSVADLTVELPYEAALQVYRIAQELMNNAIKHAQAKSIRLSLSCTATDLLLVAEDDGIGFASLSTQHSRQGGMGIPLLKERSDMLTTMGLPSSIAIDSKCGLGTKTVLTVDVSRIAKT